MKRTDRENGDLRTIRIEAGLQKYAASSILWSQGDTKVLVAVSIEEGVPAFQKGSGIGWLTAEYALLPASTQTRCKREAATGKQTGRTVEIQRLIGRALRRALDLKKIGETTVKVDCDVVQADGGTRTAAISAASLALALAADKMVKEGHWPADALKQQIAAISIGIVEEEIRLDLEYSEDSVAQVDMNVVMTEGGSFVEVQGTGEQGEFDRSQLLEMLDLAGAGCNEIFRICSDFREKIK